MRRLAIEHGGSFIALSELWLRTAPWLRIRSPRKLAGITIAWSVVDLSINHIVTADGSLRAQGAFPVVVIEDDPDDLFFITRRINKAGLRNPVVTFGDGDDAVQHFSQLVQRGSFETPACVVFCDIKMPRKNGFEVLRWFKSQPKLAPIQFVMLSGSDEAVDHARARELGANRYLVKFPSEQVFAEIIKAADAAVPASPQLQS